ncbi:MULTISPECIES: hypothetical protein [unclassified Microcoleus]|uniref:hypothetical protein n=1 Tax=unclassified Microcoleus TaxID=2642155 RepID=UPI0025F9E42F|nr:MULTISPECIES: hypothetical protein [unclassified Microcoleus]
MLRIDIKSDGLGVILGVRSSWEQDDRTTKVKLVTCPRKCLGNLLAEEQTAKRTETANNPIYLFSDDKLSFDRSFR